MEKFNPEGNFENSGDFRGKPISGGWYIYESNRPKLRPVSLLEETKKKTPLTKNTGWGDEERGVWDWGGVFRVNLRN